MGTALLGAPLDLAIVGAEVYRAPGERSPGDAIGITGDTVAVVGARVFGEARRNRLMPLRLGAEIGVPMLFNSVPVRAVRPARRDPRRGHEDRSGRDDRARLRRRCRDGVACVHDDAGRDRRRPSAWMSRTRRARRPRVLSDDPFSRATALDGLTVRATMVAGRLVYGAAELGG